MTSHRRPRNRGNLSAWALSHRPLVLFFLLVTLVAGALAYVKLGRAEDPSFTFKVMTITTKWPGATAREVELQVTDRLEKKLEEVPWYDITRSYSKPGESVIFFQLRDDVPTGKVDNLWYQVRKKIGDIRHTLPDGVVGPFFNDEFGDVYSAIYAFTGKDFAPAELKRVAEGVRARLLHLPAVEKVDLLATQTEKIFVEISSQRLASFGLPIEAVIQALQRENAIAASGNIDTGTQRVYVRVDLGIDTAEEVRSIPIESGGRLLTIGDVADIRRGYDDPLTYTMRVDGKDAVGLGVVMPKGANVLNLGEELAAELARIRADLPVGLEVQQVADQPGVVAASVQEFMHSLIEALAIVIIVSLISLGWRTGIVVALAVPLVLAMTFVVMAVVGVDLQRISLGALIISLGLLVDDAIIAVEMMVVKMEQGWDRLRAGAFAYTSTAFPMLTGTIVTAAGFLPIGLAQSSSGEYTRSIFWVVTVSLLLSWIVAVIFTPYLGYLLLPDMHKKHGKKGEIDAHHDDHEVYTSRGYQILRRVITVCLRFRWITIGVTVAAFILSIVGFGLVQQQFFPSSTRPELLVDVTLPEGSSFAATAVEVERMEKLLVGNPDVAFTLAYTGGGSPRFYLPLDQKLPNANLAQLVVMTKGPEERERVLHYIDEVAPSEFPNARIRAGRLENGPPVGYPVQFRVSGVDPDQIRQISYQVRDVMRAHSNIANTHLDWDELSKRVRLEVDTAKARSLGISKQDLSNALQLLLNGLPITQYREGTELIGVVMRTVADERLDLGRLGELSVRTGTGRAVPLSQVATLRYELEEPILSRRVRVNTLTIKADVVGGAQAPTVSMQLDEQFRALRGTLPDGYAITMGGAIEESAKGQDSIMVMMPVMLLVMLTALMVQLQSFSRVALVLLTAPLGLIGVTASLLLFNLPFGFVAMLGVIALAGIIMRNSVILVDQIEQDIRRGHSRWDAIIDATVRRTRPILLTAAAAVLAMIPLTRSTFWGPMAVALMGGLAVATVLTILFLPSLYAAWFRVRQNEEPQQTA